MKVETTTELERDLKFNVKRLIARLNDEIGREYMTFALRLEIERIEEMLSWVEDDAD
jgi:hypothetical protein